MTHYTSRLSLCCLLIVVISGVVLSCGRPRHYMPNPKSLGAIFPAPPLLDTIVSQTDSLVENAIDSTAVVPVDSLISDSDSLPVVDSLVERESLVEQAPKSLAADDSVLGDDDAEEPYPEGVEPIRLEAPIEFSAQDSMVMTRERHLYFFGPSNVEYQSMSISANYIKVNADSSEVYAQYVLDSLGHMMAKPQFADGNQKFESTTMRYNFRSQQGLITGVTTQQGEGYLTSDSTKRLPDNTMFLKNGRYTTCDHHNHPHFYINLTRAKAKPQDKIVTGPAYLVIADVPLYLIGLPFGFFPFNEKQTSGILMPSYGIDQNRGLYLTHGGLYLNFSDYYDITLRGDVYTNGSWGAQLLSNYRKRYKYSGSLSAEYVSTIQGDPEIPSTYSRGQDVSFRWTHSQDPKADPLRNFSASVNFSTSSYNRNSTEMMYDPGRRSENNKGSSISYRRSFAGLPLSLTAAFNIDQRSRDSTISVTLPNLSVSLSTIYPFKRKNRVGRERWYEKISLSYSGSLRNSITTKEHLLLKSNLLRDWRNGMQHSIPVSASFDLFNYIKISPSLQYTAYWYTSRSHKIYDEVAQRVVDADTTYGFYHLNSFSASLSVGTTLYGFFKPWRMFGDKVQMIRHRFTPNISLSYSPDFSNPWFGYYDHLEYSLPDGTPQEFVYSPYERGIFGIPSRGKNGSINFSFDNNVEMKLRRIQQDSIEGVREEFYKISLIDQLGISGSYNMAADSFRWSNISTNIALRFSPTFVLRLSGSFDPYVWDYYTDSTGKVHPYRVDKLRILSGQGFGALLGTGTSFSYTLSPQTFEKIHGWFVKSFGRSSDQVSVPVPTGTSSAPPSTPLGIDPSMDLRRGSGVGQPSEPSDNWDNYGYLNYQLPWSFSFNYSINLAQDRQRFNTRRREFEYKITQNLSFRGQIQPTPNWQFSFDANYNFDLKRLTAMSINISRQLHCWSLTASIIPIGMYKSYNLVIGVNAQMLRDLKWEQHSLPSSGNYWY